MGPIVIIGHDHATRRANRMMRRSSVRDATRKADPRGKAIMKRSRERIHSAFAARRAVLMVVDGLRADFVTPELTPHLHALAGESRRFSEHRSVFPSATRVNSASIATGCHPARHGLMGNAIALPAGSGWRPVSVGPPEFRDEWRAATGRTLWVPVLSERLRGDAVVYSNSSAGAAYMQDPDGFGLLHHRTGTFAPRPGLVPGTEPGHRRGPLRQSEGVLEDLTYDGAGDAATTERFCAALLADPGPSLWTLWICEPDHSQHALELGSPEHRSVLEGADRCVTRVADAVEALRGRGEDILFVVCSDHGHETVDAVVPVVDHLVEAGLKAAPDSPETVLASSGMGALIYLGERNDAPDPASIAAWLRAQPWCGRAFFGDELREVGLKPGAGPALAFSMAKRAAPNRYGVPGLGHVAADVFMKSDAPGRGQHGGLGPYETRPVLIVSGGGFSKGKSRARTSAVDIAPTILRHLRAPELDPPMDGRPLSSR